MCLITCHISYHYLILRCFNSYSIIIDYKGPTGSCLLDTDKLLICDTLNNKIKCVEIDGTRSAYSRSFIGSGKRGKKLVEENNVETGDKKKKEKENKDKEELLKTISLDSPQGVAYDRSKKTIYIADTGNDRILRVNRETFEISEIKLDFTNIRK